MANCIVCHRKMGMFEPKLKKFNGSCVCGECVNQAGIPIGAADRLALMNDADICAYLEKRKGIKDFFTVTDSVENHYIDENYIEVDEKHRLIKAEYCIVAIDEIIGFDIVEDGMSVTKGGFGTAVAGGLLFGTKGAIAGAALGKKKTTDVCSSLNLIIILKGSYLENLTIRFLYGEVSRHSAKYVAAQQAAKKCLKLLERITGVPEEQDEVETEPVGKNYSAADEILRFKQLLDDGIITQEEFEFQKKKLLGMTN